jgi:hypothetical protein
MEIFLLAGYHEATVPPCSEVAERSRHPLSSPGVGHSVHGKATRDARKWPCDLVGVAGFEPASSSSRSQLGLPRACLVAWLVCGSVSGIVRRRPSLPPVIVTQLVTRLDGTLGNREVVPAWGFRPVSRLLITASISAPIGKSSGRGTPLSGPAMS